jgi:hypothetical protein
MWFFWVFACVPLVIGAAVWIKSREVTWWEWVAGAAIGFVLALTFQLIAAHSMTSDTETWSGYVTRAVYHPWWKERYTETETYTDSDGNTRTRTVTKYRNHPEHWVAYGHYGAYNENFRISKERFWSISQRFGKNGRSYHKKKGSRSGMVAGDPYDYHATNESGYIFPITVWRSWENRVKAAPSVFSYAKPPKDAPIHKYPKHKDKFRSSRLLGLATSVGIRDWDLMNSRLGPYKKVNVIMVGWTSGYSMAVAQQQEALWIGGKKNDLVLCYGEDGWAYVFGWTEEEIVKRNLESILLEKEKNSNIIKPIEEEIIKNYEIKDWSKFDYISIEPPLWSYIVFIIVMVIAQIGFYIFAHLNDFRTRSGV